MKTLLFTTCYIGSEDHLLRYKRFLKYYLPKMGELGCQKIVLIDDGSPQEWLEKLGCPVYKIQDEKCYPKNAGLAKEAITPKMPKKLDAEVSVFTFERNYGRPVLTVIPGWWRSFTFASVMGITYNIDKLIHIESDSYIVSKSMFEWIKNTSDVWASPYTHRYYYAETAIQIIPRDKIGTLFQFWQLGKEYFYKNGIANIQYIPELVLPIEYVEKSFSGDRWGEDWYHEDIPDTADYVVNMGAITEGAKTYCHDIGGKHERFFDKLGILEA